MTANTTPKKKTRRATSVSVYIGNVDVDVDDVLDSMKEDGWHIPEDCDQYRDVPEHEAADDARRALLDWHDAEHGISDWVLCRQGPCAVIPHEFKDHR